MPHFPAATLRTLEVLRDDESSAADVAAALSVDPGLTVRVLRLVNSASTGLRQKVEDVPHAVQLLGRSAVESMLIPVAVQAAIPAKPARGFEPGRFWQAAARRAAVARRLAQELCPARAAASFTAALLLDMAVPLLVERQGAKYGAVLERWHAGEGELHELEREAFGWNHLRVGRVLCERWQLPEELWSAIAGHHADPVDEGADAAPEIRLAAMIREGDDAPGLPDLIEAATAEHGLERDAVTEMLAEAMEQAEELSSLLA